MNSAELSIPIYLNQRIVFDFLAIIEDGFSTISQNKLLSSTDKEKGGIIEGSVGISNAFGLFGVSLKGSRRKRKAEKDSMEIIEERIHTPTSLFSRMRSTIIENNLLKKLDSINNISGGDFIEFRAIIRKNPIVSSLERMKTLLDLVVSVNPSALNQNTQTGKGHKTSNPNNVKNNPIMKQFDAIIKGLTGSSGTDLIAEPIDSTCKIVLSSETKYFQNNNDEEIIDGEYLVLGKVIRIINEDSEESIDLLRKTSFSSLNQNFMQTLLAGFQELPEEQFKTIEIYTEVKAPALQIIPIAIFI
jgi:hypothetical protein